MRVGGPHYYPLRADSPVGGEVYERELLRRLPDHGIELALGLPRDHAPPDPRWEVETLRSARIHWTRAPLVFTPYARRIAPRVDLLRGHSVRHTGPALLAARTGLPVVLHHHHLFPRWARLEATIAARADAVVAVSEHAKGELVGHGVPAGRVHVIQEGIAAPPPTDGYPWPGDGLKVLFVGRLEDRKRPDLAIETVRRLPGASLVLAGSGDQAALRERAAGLDVTFLGHVSEDDKWRLYDTADVLLFGSTLEGFGLVVAEAQSRGVPVVAAAGTATAEALDPGVSGFLVDPDPDAFAQAVGRITPPMRDAARAFARRFDWDRCAAAVADLYRSLA